MPRQRCRAYVVVGGKNVRTGETAWGQAAGSYRHAEDDVVEKLGGNADDIRFSKSYNVVHERDMPICAPNCQPKYKPHHVPGIPGAFLARPLVCSGPPQLSADPATATETSQLRP